MNAARLALRTATARTHERTDAAFSTLDLGERGDYGVFLSSHWLAYRALEPVFAAALSAGARPPVMTGLLAEDLRALGIAPPDPAPPAFEGDALGAAYVVGGSHFGKRVLSRRHAASPDGRVRAAGRYLASPALSAYWPVLQDAMARAAAEPGRLERMAAGADAAFALFAASLARARTSSSRADAPGRLARPADGQENSLPARHRL